MALSVLAIAIMQQCIFNTEIIDDREIAVRTVLSVFMLLVAEDPIARDGEFTIRFSLTLRARRSLNLLTS
ncbi:uncharacterized protein METZ01_LOCUS338070 [marine metagenome]|uniref:Uncharacterized protein n=1 Tax=marine metagenome TaxID=408172 RepID=A0A382QIF1_9ZZZZ